MSWVEDAEFIVSIYICEFAVYFVDCFLCVRGGGNHKFTLEDLAVFVFLIYFIFLSTLTIIKVTV